jgi:F-type H+-transporting ATPase subunit a
MEMQVFGEQVLAWLGPLPITRTMVVSLCVSVVLVGAAWALRRAVLRRPDSMPSALAFLVVESVDQGVRDIVGRPAPGLVTFSGSLFLFIAGCTLAGQLPGVRTPTANLPATTALAVIVFCAVPAAGIASRGVSDYLLQYLRPNPLLLPLHLLSEVSRTVALSVRLFGNMMSGYLVVALLVSLTGFLVPMPLMALDVLIGLLQAYIFAVLATVYVGAALRTSAE